MLSDKQRGVKYHFFLVFGMTQSGIEPKSPEQLANTLLIRPMAAHKRLNLVPNCNLSCDEEDSFK